MISYLRTSNNIIEKMIIGWLDQHPDATADELFDWMFETFDEAALVKRSMFKTLAADCIKSYNIDKKRKP